jgi:hypothetical membrane protein
MGTPIGAVRSDKLTALLAAGGAIGPLVYLASIAVAGSLRPGYSPIRQAVSDLGVGPHAWLANGAGVLNFVLLTAWVVAYLRSTGPLLPAAWRWISATLLELPPIGYAVASIFTEAHATLLIHTYVGAVLGLFAPIPAFFAAGLAAARVAQWRNWSRFSIAASLVALGLVALMLWVWARGAPPRLAHFEGLAERLVIVETLAWYVVGGWHIFGRAGERLG